MSRLALGHTQPIVKWLLGALSVGVNWPVHEADTHLHIVLRLRMCGAIPPLLHTYSWCGSKLSIPYVFMKSRDSSVSIVLGYGLDNQAPRV
jgi:hypothetical protein